MLQWKSNLHSFFKWSSAIVTVTPRSGAFHFLLLCHGEINETSWVRMLSSSLAWYDTTWLLVSAVRGKTFLFSGSNISDEKMATFWNPRQVAALFHLSFQVFYVLMTLEFCMRKWRGRVHAFLCNACDSHEKQIPARLVTILIISMTEK